METTNVDMRKGEAPEAEPCLKQWCDGEIISPQYKKIIGVIINYFSNSINFDDVCRGNGGGGGVACSNPLLFSYFGRCSRFESLDDPLNYPLTLI
jgi:hypothetical protein